VIETGMVDITKALLTRDKPDVAVVGTLGANVMTEYSSVISDLQKEARSRQ
jgi:hypothetical protein